MRVNGTLKLCLSLGEHAHACVACVDKCSHMLRRNGSHFAENTLNPKQRSHKLSTVTWPYYLGFRQCGLLLECMWTQTS